MFNPKKLLIEGGKFIYDFALDVLLWTGLVFVGMWFASTPEGQAKIDELALSSPYSLDAVAGSLILMWGIISLIGTLVEMYLERRQHGKEGLAMEESNKAI